MKRNLRTIFNTAKQITLTDKEKSRILESVFNAPSPSFIKKTFGSHVHTVWGVSNVSKFSYFRIDTRFSRLTKAFTFMFLVIGITSAMAQIALPGNFLYGVKTGVNEKVQTLIAGEDTQKANLSAGFALRRLQETKELVDTHQLNAETSQVAAAQFQENTASLGDYLTTLKTEGKTKEADQIKTVFLTSVMDQDQVVTNLVDSATSSVVIALAQIDASTPSSTTTTERKPILIKTKRGTTISIEGGNIITFVSSTTKRIGIPKSAASIIILNKNNESSASSSVLK